MTLEEIHEASELGGTRLWLVRSSPETVTEEGIDVNTLGE